MAGVEIDRHTSPCRCSVLETATSAMAMLGAGTITPAPTERRVTASGSNLDTDLGGLVAALH
jgi:hypothetical protein